MSALEIDTYIPLYGKLRNAFYVCTSDKAITLSDTSNGRFVSLFAKHFGHRSIVESMKSIVCIRKYVIEVFEIGYFYIKCAEIFVKTENRYTQKCKQSILANFYLKLFIG